MNLESQAPPPDSLRAVLRAVFDAPEYQWDQPPDPLAFLRDLWDRLLLWLTELEAAHPIGYVVVLIMMTALLAGLLIHLTSLAWRALRPRLETGRQDAVTAVEIRDANWHLEQARRQVARKRYADAMAHRFLALVLRLDARAIVVFHPSKTPAEYVRDPELNEAMCGPLSELVATLYTHLFGGTRCELSDVERFDRLAGELGG